MVFKSETLVHNCARLAKLSGVMQVPLIATQQVNFGPIDERISEHHNASLTKTFEKSAFSMLGDTAVLEHLTSLNRSIAVLYGTDTVVCMLQTSKDLIDLGY